MDDKTKKLRDIKISSKQSNDYFVVSFRIMGDEVEPPELTAQLGISPSKAHRKGDTSASKTKKGKIVTYAPFNSGLWSIDSQVDVTSTLKEHLVNIIEHLEPKKDVLSKLKKEGFKMDFFCGYFFSTSIQVCISLDNDILERLSELGIEFNMLLYPQQF